MEWQKLFESNECTISMIVICIKVLEAHLQNALNALNDDNNNNNNIENNNNNNNNNNLENKVKLLLDCNNSNDVLINNLTQLSNNPQFERIVFRDFYELSTIHSKSAVKFLDGHAFSRLTNNGWINNEIIDITLGLHQFQLKTRNKNDILILNASTIEIIMENNILNYNVKTQYIPDKIWSYTKLFIPINKFNIHWLLIAINTEEKNYQIFDSIRTSLTHKYNNSQNKNNSESFKSILNSIVKSLITSIINIIPSTTNIESNSFYEKSTPNVPQQNDSFNCGIIVILNVLLLSQGQNLNNNQYNSNKLKEARRDIMISLLRGELQHSLFE